MILNPPLIVSIFCLLLCQIIQAAKYEANLLELPRDCPGKPEAFSITKYFAHDMTMEWDNDGKGFVNGSATFKKTIDSNQRINLKVAVLKKLRGQWVSSMFGIDRQDICTYFLNPEEIWYPLFENFEGDNRLCPPKIGTKYEFLNKEVSIVFEGPPTDVEGIYKFIVNVDMKEGEMCVEFEMYCEKI